MKLLGHHGMTDEILANEKSMFAYEGANFHPIV
jgi:hypothetical protein